ncbi:MAG: GntR family transcriptional regulator [Tardiphaga sp.]
MRRRPTERLERGRQAAPQVFERLRDTIISLKLPPGSALSRTALAAQYGVSSTPVRDALMRLDAEGLVEVFPQYATVVSRIDIDLARQAHFLRLALELEIVRDLALHCSDGFVGDMKRALALQQELLEAGDFEGFMVADNAFHMQFYTAAGRDGLWTLVKSRSGHIDRLRRINLPSPGKAQDILKHHKLIVKAIKNGDADAAQEHLRAHLSGTLRDVDKIRARHPEYLTD